MTMAIRSGCHCANEPHTKDKRKALLDMHKIVKYDLEDPKYLERQKQAVTAQCVFKVGTIEFALISL
jgi:hypothetical protein